MAERVILHGTLLNRCSPATPVYPLGKKQGKHKGKASSAVEEETEEAEEDEQPAFSFDEYQK